MSPAGWTRWNDILTHCNAGRLACVAWGTATAPIYHAHQAGIPVHVWVDETRPRNQGPRLTTWELAEAGIPHTLIVDNAGGHLMQHGLVDIVLVGSDRTTRSGDVCNKIGTYLKALAAHDNGIPFYAALPSSTFDWEISDGVMQIPIEERAADEVRCIEGVVDGAVGQAQITLPDTPISNFGFDVTPARLVTGLIKRMRETKRPEKLSYECSFHRRHVQQPSIRHHLTDRTVCQHLYRRRLCSWLPLYPS